MAKGIAHREWTIHRSDYDTDQDFRAAVEQEAALNVHIQERLGVAIVSAPIRTRARSGGAYFTVGYAYKTATVPSARNDEALPTDPEAYEPAPADEYAEDLAAAVGFTDDE